MPSEDRRATSRSCCDVAQRVAPRSALRARGDDEPEAVVLPERLRVHARELGGDGDREDRRVLIDVSSSIVRLTSVDLSMATRAPSP